MWTVYPDYASSDGSPCYGVAALRVEENLVQPLGANGRTLGVRDEEELIQRLDDVRLMGGGYCFSPDPQGDAFVPGRNESK